MSERPLSARKLLLRPERLSAAFEQVNGTLLMTLRWRLSLHAPDPAAVEGFQFTWTLVSKVKSAKEGLEDTVISQTQTVAPVRNRRDEVNIVTSVFKFVLILVQHLRYDWSVCAVTYLEFIACRSLVDRSL